MKNYAKITSWLLVLWFSAIFTATALGWMQRGAPNKPPISLLIAVLIPFTILGTWVALSKPFRHFLLSLNPRSLTMAHMGRLGGIAFLELARYNILPNGFALPAGYGDIFIGATAALAAARLATPTHRRLFILWQLLGVADLFTAISLGATAFLWNTGGITTAPMTALPMSLIPGFAVPLYLMLHIIAIVQAVRWKKEQQPLSDLRLNPLAA